jgi:hypothetical protein
LLSSCSESNNSSSGQASIKEKCPCDSSITFEEKGKEVTECYIKKSMIELTDISKKETGDTLAVIRYVYIDSLKKWRAQEMIWVSGEKLVPDANKAFYCDFKEERDNYLITFIRNDYILADENYPLVEKVIGTAAIMGKDTIHSKDTTLAIPKEKFKGMVKFNKIMQAVYKGQRDRFTWPMLIEAKNLIQYGNLLEQYKAISRYCKKHKAAK